MTHTFFYYSNLDIKDPCLQLCQKTRFLQKKVAILTSTESMQFIVTASEVLGSSERSVSACLPAGR